MLTCVKQATNVRSVRLPCPPNWVEPRGGGTPDRLPGVPLSDREGDEEMRSNIELQLQLIAPDLCLRDWLWQQYRDGARLVEISRRLSEISGITVPTTRVREWMIE